VLETDLVKLRQQLELHEGKRFRPYRDTVGKLTVGIGRNIDDVPFSEDEITLMFENDVAQRVGALSARLPWFATLDAIRQRVLIDMSFMGVETFLGFHETLAAVRDGQYGRAATRMLASKWAGQVGGRAIRLAEMMRTGTDYTAH
jgi:lysozyme